MKSIFQTFGKVIKQSFLKSNMSRKEVNGIDITYRAVEYDAEAAIGEICTKNTLILKTIAYA